MEDNKRRGTFTAMRLSRVAVVVRYSRREPTPATYGTDEFLCGIVTVLSLLLVFSVMVK